MAKVINKILIANRGEIAMRVIKTCKKMGIESVSLFSKFDKDLPHALYADESYLLEGETLAQTYLNIDKIISIAKASGADAIHPGYGFLSENAQFAVELEKNGIIFIGPGVDAITLMGDKKSSKQRMSEIGIPLVPGYHGDDQSASLLKDEANKIGYPVLIKATAGGGGKGMKIVRNEKDFEEALSMAKSEAKKSFGDDRVLLEKYIESPRHIEVQLVSDSHGNHLHFYERECSIQRRYQKVIEETPSPALDDKLREQICSTAVEIARGINYLGAGTIEYILAPNNEFYFLEMNTRLQVEHPVTEMVTGVDLVELQIKAAAGEAFELSQSEISQNGHSIECRIYAENPDNNFMPSIGKLTYIADDKDFRLDTGFKKGNEVTTNFDPMLAKLVVHGSDRSDSIKKTIEALNKTYFAGVKTNRDYLKRVLSHKDFKKGEMDTHFLVHNKDDLVPKETLKQDIVLSIAKYLFDDKAQKSSWNTIKNFRNS